MQPRDLKMTTRRKILINETKSGLRPRLYSCCTHSLVMNTLNPTDSQTLCRTKETRSNWSEGLYRNTLVHESFDGGFFWFLRLKIPRRMFNHFHCTVLQTTFFFIDCWNPEPNRVSQPRFASNEVCACFFLHFERWRIKKMQDRLSF